MKTNFLKSRTRTLVALVLALSFTAINCSKDDDQVPDTRLILPATIENLTVFPIPDATNNTGGCGSNTNLGSVVSTVEITDDGIIADPSKVVIQIDIAHAWGGDITAELIAPNGESCGLIKRIGSLNDTGCFFSGDFIAGNKLNFNSTFTNITLTNPVATGNYAQLHGVSTFPTSVPMTLLSNFLKDKNIKGIWKIKMYDSGVGDTGTINAWKLSFEVGALQ